MATSEPSGPSEPTEAAEHAEAPGVEPQVERPGWSRFVIFGAAALALLLVGATIGMVITRNTDTADTASAQPSSVDVGFAQDMSVHHLQAVTMANWARDHSKDPALVQIAFDMASTQLEQIGRMKGWLSLWDKPEEATGAYMTWMTEPGGHSMSHRGSSGSGGSAMPGMATTKEMSKLRSLSGEQLDVYFLQLMLRHHQGGSDMAKYAYDHSSLPAVRTLANSMLKSQGTEMDLMRRMLREHDAKPLAFP